MSGDLDGIPDEFGLCRIVEREKEFSRSTMALAYAGRTSPANA